MQPLSGKVRVECQKLRVFCDFCEFFWSGAPLSGKTRVECQKLGFFLRFFFGRVHPSQGKRGSSVKNCVFGGPESVLKTVLTIRFASYGRFFERGKMSENRQKTSKTGGFWRFFRVRSNPLRESGCRVSKTGDFGVPESVLTIRFASYGLLQTLSRGEKRWFQTSLKPV